MRIPRVKPDPDEKAEDEWAEASWRGRWFANGLVRNAFAHQPRRGKAARKWSTDRTDHDDRDDE